MILTVETDVLVLGGGFAGFWAALAARACGGPTLRIALVSREPLLQLRPRLYEAHPETLAVPLDPMLRRADVTLIEGEVTCIDAEAREVHLGNGARDEATSRTSESGGRRLRYRALVVATGSRMRRPGFAGAGEAWSIDTQTEAIAFDDRLAQIARAAPREPCIAVVGAGFTGIELALEMRDRLAQHGGEALAERTQVLLVDAARDPGKRIGKAAWAVIAEALARSRVQLRLGVRVQQLRGDELLLDDGTRCHVDAVVLATGVEAAPAARWVPGTHDASGRLVVDAYLRVRGGRHARGVGGVGTAHLGRRNAAAADDGSGHDTVASCQHALQTGRVAGANAARTLLGQQAVPFTARPYVTCIDLGREGALFTHGRERAVQRHGAAAKATKQHINRVAIHPPEHAPRDELLALALPPALRQPAAVVSAAATPASTSTGA